MNDKYINEKDDSSLNDGPSDEELSKIEDEFDF